MYTRNNIKNVESSSGSLEDRRSLPFVLKHTPVLRTRQHVITFYVQKEQYEKDIKSSRGSLEDRRSFSFIELYILVFYVHEHVTTPRQFTPAQNQTTSQQQNNKTQKPSHHNNKQQNAKTITRAPIQWRT